MDIVILVFELNNSIAKEYVFLLFADPPILMSGPHFYQGDPMYYEAVDGLKPNPEKHGTFLYVEPVS